MISILELPEKMHRQFTGVDRDLFHHVPVKGRLLIADDMYRFVCLVRDFNNANLKPDNAAFDPFSMGKI